MLYNIILGYLVFGFFIWSVYNLFLFVTSKLLESQLKEGFNELKNKRKNMDISFDEFKKGIGKVYSINPIKSVLFSMLFWPKFFLAYFWTIKHKKIVYKNGRIISE